MIGKTEFSNTPSIPVPFYLVKTSSPSYRVRLEATVVGFFYLYLHCYEETKLALVIHTVHSRH